MYIRWLIRTVAVWVAWGSQGVCAHAQAGLLETVNPEERETTVVATERTQCAVFSLALYTAALAELSVLPAKGYFLRFLLDRCCLSRAGWASWRFTDAG